MSQENVHLEESWIHRAVRKRYGLTMLFLLVAWTLLGFIPALAPVLANGLLLDNYPRLGFFTFTNCIAVVFCLATLRLLNRRFPSRSLLAVVGDGTKPWGRSELGLALALAVISPVILGRWFGSEFEFLGVAHFGASAVAIAVGAALSVLSLWGVAKLKGRLFGSSRDFEHYFPFESSAPADGALTTLKTTMIHVGGKIGLEGADFQLAIYLGVVASCNWLAARLALGGEAVLTSAPSMVVVLIWIGCMVLGGFANLLDRYRLPVLGICLVAITVWQIPWGSTRALETVPDTSTNQYVKEIASVRGLEDEYLTIEPEEAQQTRTELIQGATSKMEEAAWNAIKTRMENVHDTDLNAKKRAGKTLVLVTCPGGGIHAAAWTSYVLAALSREYEDFSESVCVISAVSGGSVGTLMFASQEYQQALSSGEDSAQTLSLKMFDDLAAFKLATESSLESIAYGMVTDDLYGVVLPVLCMRDRGQRLEDSLARRLPANQAELTLGQWGDVALAGDMPIVIFNATDAATGRRVLFDSIPTPRRLSDVGQRSRPLNYRELMDVQSGTAYDVKPASAARASATFPYISPFVKLGKENAQGASAALCDGGYADNEGIVSAVNWTEFILRNWADELQAGAPTSFERILILRIEPSANVDANNAPPSSGLAPWFRWLAGPIETIAKVRSASQAERGNLETDLASLYLSFQSEGEAAEGVGSESIPKKVLGNAFATMKVENNFQEAQSAYRGHNRSKLDIKNDWNAKIKDFQMERSARGKQTPSLKTEAPRQPAVVSTPDDSLADDPIIVRQVKFEQFEQDIPLNWKLTKEQKLWYPYAWETYAEPQLRKTLDLFFTPRGN